MQMVTRGQKKTYTLPSPSYSPPLRKWPLRPEFEEIIYEKHPEYTVLGLERSGNLRGINDLQNKHVHSKRPRHWNASFHFQKAAVNGHGRSVSIALLSGTWATLPSKCLLTVGQGQNIREVWGKHLPRCAGVSGVTSFSTLQRRCPGYTAQI